jgi:hypothetical protein
VQRWGNLLACVVVCAALLAAGCGDSGRTASSAERASTAPAAPPARPHDDRGFAQLALIARADVPTHVAEQDNSRNHAECSPRRLFRRLATGIATTPHYMTDDETGVQQSVLLFRDAATAAHAFAVLDAPAKQRCIAAYVRRAASQRSGRAVPQLTPQAITVEPAGQQSSAYRLTTAVIGGQAAVDVLVNRFGRALSSVAVEWYTPPHDLEFDEALVQRIAARVRQAMR